MPLDSHPTRPEAWVAPVPKDIEIDQYTVRADAQAGEWLGEPVFVGKVLESEWHEKGDTDQVHYDCYEHQDDDGREQKTRAIELVWVEAAAEVEDEAEEDVYVPTCRAISEAHSLKGVVNIINDDGPVGPDMTPAQLAGQYAHEAADEAGYGCGEAEIEAWLESLSDAGAVFDVCDATKHASAIEHARKCCKKQNLG